MSLWVVALLLANAVAPCVSFRSAAGSAGLRAGLRAHRKVSLDASSTSYQFGSQRSICLNDKLGPLQRDLAAYANVVSNDVINKMIIGYRPALAQLKNEFPVFEQEVSALWDKSLKAFGEPSAYNEDTLVQTQSYLRRLSAIAAGQWDTDAPLAEPYGSASAKVLEVLRSAKYNPSVGGILDSNICLSLQDQLNADNSGYDSEIRTINSVSNCVARALKYCDLKSRLALADSIEYNMGHRGAYPRIDGQRPQECFFAQSLLSLLREGRAKTEPLITYLGPASSDKPGTSDIFNYIPGISAKKFKAEPRNRLVEPFRSVFFRVLKAAEPNREMYLSPPSATKKK